MRSVIYAFLSTVGVLFRSRLSLQAEIMALRHQLTVYRRSVQRPQHSPRGPTPLLVAVASLGEMAGGLGVCSARDRDRLAAQALS